MQDYFEMLRASSKARSSMLLLPVWRVSVQEDNILKGKGVSKWIDIAKERVDGALGVLQLHKEKLDQKFMAWAQEQQEKHGDLTNYFVQEDNILPSFKGMTWEDCAAHLEQTMPSLINWATAVITAHNQNVDDMQTDEEVDNMIDLSNQDTNSPVFLSSYVTPQDFDFMSRALTHATQAREVTWRLKEGEIGSAMTTDWPQGIHFAKKVKEKSNLVHYQAKDANGTLYPDSTSLSDAFVSMARQHLFLNHSTCWSDMPEALFKRVATVIRTVPDRLGKNKNRAMFSDSHEMTALKTVALPFLKARLEQSSTSAADAEQINSAWKQYINEILLVAPSKADYTTCVDPTCPFLILVNQHGALSGQADDRIKAIVWSADREHQANTINGQEGENACVRPTRIRA